jgi:hypothetical protein
MEPLDSSKQLLSTGPIHPWWFHNPQTITDRGLQTFEHFLTDAGEDLLTSSSATVESCRIQQPQNEAEQYAIQFEKLSKMLQDIFNNDSVL